MPENVHSPGPLRVLGRKKSTGTPLRKIESHFSYRFNSHITTFGGASVPFSIGSTRLVVDPTHPHYPVSYNWAQTCFDPPPMKLYSILIEQTMLVIFSMHGCSILIEQRHILCERENMSSDSTGLWSCTPQLSCVGSCDYVLSGRVSRQSFAPLR